MMFAEAYLSTAQHLIEQYSLQMPLPLYLKNYFRSNRKFGSRDRRYISELVFGYYRLPPDLVMSIRDRMSWGACLGRRLPSVYFDKVMPELSSSSTLSFSDLYSFFENKMGRVDWFPHALSSSLSHSEYLPYFFHPKSFFIRIRKQKEKLVSLLKKNNLSFELLPHHCIRFDHHVDLKEILTDESSYVIQDLGTQRCGDFFHPKDHEIWWDCCAASGGKSLLVLDKNPHVELYVSDIRESILHNLRERLSVYGYSVLKKCFVLDVATITQLPFPSPDVIVCDVPCSGSGTWAQAPEQYYYFSEEKLNGFHNLQVKIASQAIRFLKPGGRFFYITCSIFQHENEDVIHHLTSHLNVELISMQLINESKQGGDMIFLAELLKLIE